MQSFAILGLSRFGQSVARNLSELGYEVLAIDENEGIVQGISEHITCAMVGNVTDENVLKAAGIKNFNAVVVSTGKNLVSSILVTQMLKELGIKYILAKAQNELHAKVLTKLGADRVVLPEQDMGIRVAHNLASTNIIDYIELSQDYTIIEVKVPVNWVGKTLRSLNVRAKHGINIIAIKNGTKIKVSPSVEYIFDDNDILYIIGSKSDIEKF